MGGPIRERLFFQWKQKNGTEECSMEGVLVGPVLKTGHCLDMGEGSGVISGQRERPRRTQGDFKGML